MSDFISPKEYARYYILDGETSKANDISNHNVKIYLLWFSISIFLVLAIVSSSSIRIEILLIPYFALWYIFFKKMIKSKDQYNAILKQWTQENKKLWNLDKTRRKFFDTIIARLEREVSHKSWTDIPWE